MEETFLKLAASLGGFAGLAFFGVIFFIGRQVLELSKAIDRQTKMELMRLIASPHVSSDVKVQLESQLDDVNRAIQKTERK